MIAGLEQRGLKRSEIARQSGVSRATVSRYGNGYAKAPAYECVVRIKNLSAAYRISDLKQK